jgi:hypothetical protein
MTAGAFLPTKAPMRELLPELIPRLDPLDACLLVLERTSTDLLTLNDLPEDLRTPVAAFGR